MAARITLLAYFSSLVVVRRETGPEMHMEPSRRQLSPHIGGVTADAYVKMGVGAVENLLTVLRS